MTKEPDRKDKTIDKFQTILYDLFIVYEHTNGEIITSNVLPVDFYQDDPTQIITSLKHHKIDKVTSIKNNYELGAYEKSPYKLFHDIKTVSSILLNKHSVNSDGYKEIDFFFKFSTELLLREVGNRIVFNKKLKTRDIKNDLEQQLEEEFTKVISTYNITNGEIITYVSKTEEVEPPTSYYQQQQPPVVKTKIQQLFSSVIEKSSLDQSQNIVKEPYSISKLIPIIKDSSSFSTFETLSPVSNKIPLPLEATSTILHDFFHPTWYTISMPTWLTYKSSTIKPATILSNQSTESSLNNGGPKLSLFQSKGNESSDASVSWGPGNNHRSFAPIQDSKGAFIGNKLVADVWLQQIGLEEISRLKKSFKGEPIEDDVKGDEVQEEVMDNIEEVESNEVKEEEPVDLKSSTEINIANLVEWDPIKIEELEFLKQQRQDILNPQRLQKLLSVSLLKLNKLRQERFSKSDVRNPMAPNDQEIKVYSKIQRLIYLTIELYKIKPQQFSYEFSKRIPVLMTEYHGTLPGLPPNRYVTNTNVSSAQNLPRTNRLPNLRQPSYMRTRKSSRLQ